MIIKGKGTKCFAGRRLLAVVPGLLLVLPVAGWGEDPVPMPTAEALELAAGLRTSRLGVDRFNNLWSLNRRSGAVQVLAPTAALLLSTRLEQVSAIDFDPEWGLVALHRAGRKLQFHDPDGTHRSDLELPDPVADVAWVGAGRVAVSPMRLDHRVQIWDVAEGRRLASWGEEEPVRERLGMSRQNQFLLDYDHTRSLLATFDAYWGDLEVFDASGKVVAHHRLGFSDPDQQTVLEAQIREVDARMRAKGETEYVTFGNHLGFAKSRHGIWLLDSCARDQQGAPTSIQVVHIPTAGLEVSEKEMGANQISLSSPPCCLTHLAEWGEELILYFSADNPRGSCRWIQEVPNVD